MAEQEKSQGTVEFAQVDGKVAVIRFVGRCSFQNSAFLEKAAEICENEGGAASFVLDLDRCDYMDSTFLGTLAGLALRQRRLGRGNLIAVNVPSHLRRTMTQLGLTHVVEIHERMPEGVAEQEVEIGESNRVEMSRADQVAHMIQAHQRLIEVDSGNEVRFNNVLKFLDESLTRARQERTENNTDGKDSKNR